MGLKPNKTFRAVSFWQFFTKFQTKWAEISDKYRNNLNKNLAYYQGTQVLQCYNTSTVSYSTYITIICVYKSWKGSSSSTSSAIRASIICPKLWTILNQEEFVTCLFSRFYIKTLTEKYLNRKK